MSTHEETKEKKEFKETDEYYRDKLDPVFALLKTPAYITVGRWSYAQDFSNPRIFNPGGVGGLDPQVATLLDQEFRTSKFRQALKEFSFTKLLADTDQEVWFHFTNDNPPLKGEAQVYANPNITINKTPLIEVGALSVTPELVDQIVDVFQEQTRVTHYDGNPLRDKTDAIAATLEAAIFSLFNKPEYGIRHVLFMPVMVPAAKKNVLGIVSINSFERVFVGSLEPILQPFAEGIMAPFHLQEIDEQRRRFSLRSAIAAIMSRNMSHNIGSHVLWHLSQQLKK